MSNLKRFAVGLLTLLLVLAPETGSFATESVTNETDHSYNAYQIFAGTQAAGETTGKLAVTDWGNGIKGTDFLAALKASGNFGSPNIFAEAFSALDVANALASNTTYAGAFAALAHEYTAAIPSAEIASNAENIELAPGYYLLVDTTAVTGTGDAKNVSLLQVTQNGEVKIAKKYGVPSVEKKVKDTNDTTGETTDWQDSADYDIGDKVPFKLTGTMPSNLDDYESYFYQFTDTLSAGLTYDADSLKVKLDGTDVTSHFTINNAGGSLTVKCDDIKTIPGVTLTKDSKIEVEYTATLNESAVVGGSGNTNKVSLTFSNNPNAGGETETGKSPEDTVTVFTYKLVVNKTDGTSPLAGAEFTLSKKLSDGSEKDFIAVKNPEGTVFTFSGLDDGTYVLKETKVPAGYNKAADITFTVTAEHEITSDNPDLTNLSADGGEATFTSNIGEGSLSTDVVNKSGAVLPETGGIGTMIFYALGAALAIFAGILLVSKKRMKNEN